MRDSIVHPVVAAILFISLPAMATDIKEKEYGYTYGDTVKSMGKEAFVVCSGCGADKLIKAPSDLVAIKYNPRVAGDSAPVVDYQSAFEPAVQEHKSPAHVSSLAETLAGTVLFRFGSDKLQDAEKLKLDKIVASMPTGVDLTINGYACNIGKQNYNKKLSERRADTVATYLKNKGAEIKAVEGNGECCAISKTNKNLNRRVEVTEKEKN